MLLSNKSEESSLSHIKLNMGPIVEILTYKIQSPLDYQESPNSNSYILNSKPIFVFVHDTQHCDSLIEYYSNGFNSLFYVMMMLFSLEGEGILGLLS
jgi:hypothetical protein